MFKGRKVDVAGSFPLTWFHPQSLQPSNDEDLTQSLSQINDVHTNISYFVSPPLKLRLKYLSNVCMRGGRTELLQKKVKHLLFYLSKVLKVKVLVVYSVVSSPAMLLLHSAQGGGI